LLDVLALEHTFCPQFPSPLHNQIEISTMPDYTFTHDSEPTAALILALVDESPLSKQAKLDIAHAGMTVAELKASCLCQISSDGIARIQGELRAGQNSEPSIEELVACVHKLAAPLGELQVSLRGIIESLCKMENLVSGVGIGSRAARSADDVKFPFSARNTDEKGNGKWAATQQPCSLFGLSAAEKFGEGRTQSPGHNLFLGGDKPAFGGSTYVPVEKSPEISGQGWGGETGLKAKAGVVCGQSPTRKLDGAQTPRPYQGGGLFGGNNNKLGSPEKIIADRHPLLFFGPTVA
jgi:hypothetical protein